METLHIVSGFQCKVRRHVIMENFFFNDDSFPYRVRDLLTYGFYTLLLLIWDIRLEVNKELKSMNQRDRKCCMISNPRALFFAAVETSVTRFDVFRKIERGNEGRKKLFPHSFLYAHFSKIEGPHGYLYFK